MARLVTAPSGKSLGFIEGLPPLRPSDLLHILRRSALTATALGALVAAVAATTMASRGAANPGVVIDASQGVVVRVDPTGYGWAAGIRPGQLVLDVTSADDPGGWRVVTMDGDRTIRAGAATHDDVAKTLPMAIGGVVLGLLAVLLLRTRRRWVLPVSAAALLASALPIGAQGDVESSTLALLAALLVPSSAIVAGLPGRGRVRLAAAAAIGAFAIVWLVARLAGSNDAVELEATRRTIALWSTIGLVGSRIFWPILSGEPLGVTRPRLVDLTVIAGIGSIVLLATASASLPFPIVIGALLLLGMLLPATRRSIGQGLEDAVFGDVRAAAAAEAAEAERGRLARELHDVPLQELAAVIRRLEVLPGAEAESEDLRALADRLRNVATGLRPPVLDDLGLPAALDYLGEEASTPALPVRVQVVDDTGFSADRRPPAEVELAVFRVAAEAVGNATRHSGGSEIRIRADIAPSRVHLEVADDGAGLDPASANGAARSKRLGLASMRRRAQAIDAELTIDGSTAGTTVTLLWKG